MTTRLPGLVLMAISALAFSLMAAVIRVLRDTGMPSGEIMFFRGLFCTVLTAWGLRAAQVSLAGTRKGLLLFRGGCGLLGLFLYCEALGRIPLADAMALQYTHPMFAALFAWVFLRERMPRTAPWAMLLCAAGAFVILNPQGTGDLSGNMIGLASGVVSGLAYTVVRGLSRTEHPLVIMLAYHVATLLFGTAMLAAGDFVWPQGTDWLWLLALIVTSQAGQWFLTNGLRKEKAGVATTVGYTAIAWGVVLAIVGFGEAVSVGVPAGTALMALGLGLLARR